MLSFTTLALIMTVAFPLVSLPDTMEMLRNCLRVRNVFKRLVIVKLISLLCDRKSSRVMEVYQPYSSASCLQGGVFSADGPAPLISQATGMMPSSIAVTQQPLPMFRPPAGINISHYPPNYFPYGHYLPPFYVPPLAIHQYLGNGSFPQQPQAGGMFPAPPTIGTVGVKYSLPQYKQGTNTGNSAHMGMATGYYGPYGSSVGGYNLNSGATPGNPTTNENLGQSQFKENNVYLAGQQQVRF